MTKRFLSRKILSCEFLKQQAAARYPPVLFYVILIEEPLVANEILRSQSSLPQNDINLHIKIQTHLKRVWAVAHGEVFRLSFVIHPLLDHILAEDSAFGEESVVTLKGRERFVKRGW